MRLNRHLSLCGLGSRRGCEALILEGRVTINGGICQDLATQVGPEDEIYVDGSKVEPAGGVVLAFHKPRGYVCSRGDTHKRATIYALLPAEYQTLHHVGRLDKESEGLLLLTNRGDISHRLMHPSQGVEKEYEVVVDKQLSTAVIAKLVRGMQTEEGYAKAERAWMATDHRLHVVLKQGLKRQIRLMLYTLGFEVQTLIRLRIGWLGLKGIPRGAWRPLSEAEVQRFFSETARAIGVTPTPKARKAPSPSGGNARPPRGKFGGDSKGPRGRSKDRDDGYDRPKRRSPERGEKRDSSDRPRSRIGEGEDFFSRSDAPKRRGLERSEGRSKPSSRPRSHSSEGDDFFSRSDAPKRRGPERSEGNGKPGGRPRSRSSDREDYFGRSDGPKRRTPDRGEGGGRSDRPRRPGRSDDTRRPPSRGPRGKR